MSAPTPPSGPSPSERLAALGLTLPPVPAPLAAYVPAVRSGGLVWTSGQLPTVDGTPLALGPVGEGPDAVDVATAADCARAAALNALAVIDALVGLDRVVQVVKVVGYVASAPGFTAQPQVVNGASVLLGDVFGEAGRHARSAVGVAALPLGVPVEIELVVAVQDEVAAAVTEELL